MTLHRRQALLRGLAGGLTLALPYPASAARYAPFKKVAVMDPPYMEEYEVLIATSPPLVRGTVAKLIARAITDTDTQLKSDKLTAALDPDKTDLHGHFVRTLADALDDADAKVLLVPVEPAKTEAALMKQVLEKAPQADALLLANVMGRFVALHGLAAYAPGVIAGVKVRNRSGDKVWLDQIFSAGFRGIDPRADHLEVADMPERFDNVEALLGHTDDARNALIRGTEAIAQEVANRLMA